MRDHWPTGGWVKSGRAGVGNEASPARQHSRKQADGLVFVALLSGQRALVGHATLHTFQHTNVFGQGWVVNARPLSGSRGSPEDGAVSLLASINSLLGKGGRAPSAAPVNFARHATAATLPGAALCRQRNDACSSPISTTHARMRPARRGWVSAQLDWWWPAPCESAPPLLRSSLHG